GGEGQLYMGALFATWAAAYFAALPAWELLPLVAALGFLGGGLWAAISGVMRAYGWVSETISTLLLNYVAILIVSFFVFGPWKDPESANYPQTAEFVAAAGLAGLAGVGEVSAIQGRLRPSLSPGYGYTGFLISWIAGGNPYGIVAAALLMAVITAGGDVLQMAHRLPGSVVNILMALMLFVVLARRRVP